MEMRLDWPWGYFVNRLAKPARPSMPSPSRAAVWPESGTLVTDEKVIAVPDEEVLNWNVPSVSSKPAEVVLAVPVPMMMRVPKVTELSVIDAKSNE